MKTLKIVTKILTIFSIFAIFQVTLQAAVLKTGEKAPLVTLKESRVAPIEQAGKPDVVDWSSDEIKDFVHVLFYVDPDEKELNRPFQDRLSKEEYPKEHYKTIAVINMESTKMPNFAISLSLKGSQKEYPNTLYLKDYKKTLVKKWGLQDETYDVVIFSKTSQILYSFNGKMSEKDIEEAVSIINKELKDLLTKDVKAPNDSK